MLTASKDDLNKYFRLVKPSTLIYSPVAMEILFQNWTNATYVILQIFILKYNLGKFSMTLNIMLYLRLWL